MLTQYEGYFENGVFYNNERQPIKIPEQHKVFITLFDERVNKTVEANLHKKQMHNDIGEKRRALLGCMKGKIWMSDDFDDPLEEMREYME